jgi:hypothetical protein
VNQRAPVVHLGLGAVAVAMALVGGRTRLGSWGSVPLVRAAAWLAAATTLHGIGQRLPRGGLVVRGLAWGLALGATFDLEALLRPQVVGPLALLAAADLVLAARSADAEGPSPDAVGRLVAGGATVAALGLLAVVLSLARSATIGLRLAATVTVGWAVVTALGLYPARRSTGTLLGGAGLVGVAFLVLAAPVLPFGPLLAWVVMVGSVALAVVAASFEAASPSLAPGRSRHRQTVVPVPDPELAPLADDVQRYLETGGAEELSRRVEAALEVDEGGALLEQSARELAGGPPDPEHRRRALAQLLDVPDLDGERA